MLSPPQQFPAADLNTRAFATAMEVSAATKAAATTCAAAGTWPCVHPTEVGGQGMTADEFYRLILSIDMGGQFFSRENKAEASTP